MTQARDPYRTLRILLGQDRELRLGAIERACQAQELAQKQAAILVDGRRAQACGDRRDRVGQAPVREGDVDGLGGTHRAPTAVTSLKLAAMLSIWKCGLSLIVQPSAPGRPGTS